MSEQKTARQRVFISPYEAAEHIGVSSRTIRRWIAEGRLRAVRFGPRTIRVRLEDLEAVGAAVPTVGGAA